MSLLYTNIKNQPDLDQFCIYSCPRDSAKLRTKANTGSCYATLTTVVSGANNLYLFKHSICFDLDIARCTSII